MNHIINYCGAAILNYEGKMHSLTLYFKNIEDKNKFKKGEILYNGRLASVPGNYIYGGNYEIGKPLYKANEEKMQFANFLRWYLDIMEPDDDKIINKAKINDPDAIEEWKLHNYSYNTILPLFEKAPIEDDLTIRFEDEFLENFDFEI